MIMPQSSPLTSALVFMEALRFRFGVVAASFLKGGRSEESSPPCKKALRLAKTKT
jgi:hypothetical protein